MTQQETEQKAELLATIQHDHVPMKQWYNTSPIAKKVLHLQHGSEYPAFARDVIHWKGWKDTRKLFLRDKESKEGKLQKERERQQKIKQEEQIKKEDPIKREDSNKEEKPRKRRSRWGTAPAIKEEPSEPPRRKSRWARGRDETPKPVNGAAFALPGVPRSSGGSVLDLLPGLPASLTAAQSTELKELQAKLRTANFKLENLEKEAKRVDALPVGHADRSPSPPPGMFYGLLLFVHIYLLCFLNLFFLSLFLLFSLFIVYGADGKRKNTRAIRWRERYTSQRQDTLEQILQLTNPTSTNSIAPSLFKRKRTRKIYIPVEQHPTYNFIGLIIGPRGKTQKEMEEKTNCKIAIRGKGSVKEGARGRRDGQIFEGDNEPLHVVITGESQANVDAAADMVNQMLVVIDDDKNVHKQQQLRELALLNGTLKEEEYCPICAEKGHRAFECPKRFTNKATTSIKCAICGDTSHPTRDCKLRKEGMENATDEANAQQLDSDYLAFMNELDGKNGGGGTKTSVITTLGPDGKPALCPPADPPKDPTPVAKPAEASVITTISSRVLKGEEAAASAAGTVATSMTGVTPVPPVAGVISSSGAPLPPAQPITAPPPPITPYGTAPGVTTSTLPPPPEGMPPPPPPAAYGTAPTGTYAYPIQPPPGQPYGGYSYPPPQQQHTQGYVDPNAAYYQQASQGYPYNQNQQPQQGQTQGNGGANGWDYRSYYGNTSTGGDSGGAGGFNWWE